MHRFLRALADQGRVQVEVGGTLPPCDAPALAALAALDAATREDLPGTAPPLDLASAAAAANLLYRACRFLLDRTASPAQIEGELQANELRGDDAATVYSVDLTLRYLPDLSRLAAGLAAGDPLVAALQGLGAGWPLSSVGMRLPSPPLLPDCLHTHASLRGLYIDRILAARDTTRLDVGWVRMAIRGALGEHRQLAPAIAAEIEQRETHDG